jgi:hypothetical protein
MKTWMLVVVLCVVGIIFNLQAQAPSSPLARLLKVSNREFIDPNAIDYVLLPIYVDPPAGCPDCQTRSGAQVQYQPEAEAKLKELLGVR